MQDINFEKESYDLIYTNSEEYKKHYSKVRYYSVWKYIMKKLSREDKILDLGCGPGHFAQMLYDNGFKTYVGIDFSQVAIDQAKLKVPSYVFRKGNIMGITNYEKYTGFKYVCIETLEHLKDDIEFIKMLPPKKYMIFSVPNYMCANHYRTYNSTKYIIQYYKEIFDIISIKCFNMGGNNRIFVVEANIK